MRSRATVVVIAVVVPLAVLAGIVAFGRGSTHGPAKLPLSLGATGERAAAADIALAPYPAVVYRAGDGLPALDGSARAYKIRGDVDASVVSRIADAFGVVGTPVADDYGGFSVTDGDAQVTVYPNGGGGWTYARSTSGAVSSGGVAVSCPADAECPVPETTVPQPPPNLPTEDEARKIALDAMSRAGVSVDGAKVSVDNAFSQWSVHVDAVLDGIATEGFGATVAVGPDGVIEYASGMLGRAEAADEYPLIGSAKAIENLNAGKGFAGPIPLGARDVAVASPAIAPASGAASAPGAPPIAPHPTQLPPCDGTGAPTTFACTDTTTETLAPPPPQEVTITGAERILLGVASYDGNDLFLVPGYRFTYGEDPSTISVIAIDESYVAPPPATSTPATDDVKTDPGSIEPAPPEVTIEPQPIPQPQEKPSTGG